ncbi:hypothetical protein GF389_03815 [Candidatus Dojkabacteria bacterium]|nr:hypothetical protein [Candidatus Dojkabacteria bacterium]
MNRTVTIILIIVALALGVGAIYFGYQLTQEDEPADTGDDTSVATGCPGDGRFDSVEACIVSCQEGSPGPGSDWYNGCPAACDSLCKGADGGCGDDVCAGGTTENAANCPQDCYQEDPDCTISVPSVTSCIELGSGCSNVEVEIYWEVAENGTTNGQCVGINSNGTTKNFDGPATICPRNYGPGGAGYCVQIDTPGGGSAQFTGDKETPASCGDGEINQNSEECEVGIACSGSNTGERCNTSNCTCSPRQNNDTCGDGEINQDTEECEVGVACTEGGFTCDTSTCSCVEVPDTCGDGTIDTGEFCDYAADPAGCIQGEVCNSLCQCVDDGTNVIDGGSLPDTAIIDDETDKLIYAVAAVVAGLLLLKFNVKGFVFGILNRTLNLLQTGSFAYLTAPVSEKAQNEVRTKKKNKFEKRVNK